MVAYMNRESLEKTLETATRCSGACPAGSCGTWGAPMATAKSAHPLLRLRRGHAARPRSTRQAQTVTRVRIAALPAGTMDEGSAKRGRKHSPRNLRRKS
jgi:hypothetical protein